MKQILVTSIVYLLLVSSLAVGITQANTDSNVELNRLIELDNDRFGNPLIKLNAANEILENPNFQTNRELLLLAAIVAVEAKVDLERVVETRDMINKFLPEARALGRKDLVARFLMGELTVFDAGNNIKESALARENLLVIKDEIVDPILSADILMAVGYSQYLNNQNYLAVGNFEKAFKTYKKLNFEYGLGSAYNALANIYSSDGDLMLALNYFNKALDISLKFGDELTTSVMMYNIALTYTSMDNETQNAIESLNRSMEISKKLNDTVGLAYSQYSLAFIHLELEQYQQAEQLLMICHEVFLKQGKLRMYYASLLGLVDSHLKQQNTDVAKDYLSKAEKYSDQYENPNYPSYYLKLTAQYDYQTGSYKAGYEKLKDYAKNLLEHHEQQRQQRVDELLIQFDSKEKLAENALLLKENELHQLKSQQQQAKLLFWSVVAVSTIAIVFVIGYLLYIQTRNRNRYQRMALRDHLTHAPNRRAILQYAEEKYEEAKQTGMDLTIALIDLDYFKKFNDRYGHDVGDEVLVTFALACKEILRRQDRFGRYGGEEWLFVLSDTNKEEVVNIFNRLRSKYNEYPIKGVPDDVIRCFSMGVAGYQKGTDKSVQTMINRADENLYKAKDLGRDQVVQ